MVDGNLWAKNMILHFKKEQTHITYAGEVEHDEEDSEPKANPQKLVQVLNLLNWGGVNIECVWHG